MAMAISGRVEKQICSYRSITLMQIANVKLQYQDMTQNMSELS